MNSLVLACSTYKSLYELDNNSYMNINGLLKEFLSDMAKTFVNKKVIITILGNEHQGRITSIHAWCGDISIRVNHDFEVNYVKSTNIKFV